MTNCASREKSFGALFFSGVFMGEVVQFIPRTKHLVRDLSEPVVVVPLPSKAEDEIEYIAPPCDSA